MSTANIHLDDEQDIDGIHPAPYAATNWRHWWAQAHGSKLHEGTEQGFLDAESNRKLGNRAMTAASTGISAAQTATGTSALGLAKAAAFGAGATVSATGIGLIAAGGVAMVTSSVTSGVSYFKTKAHLSGLVKIYEEREKYSNCWCIEGRKMQKTATNARQHDIIANQILPYIISQKEKKKDKKAVGMVPAVGSSVNTLQSFWHNLKKRWDGTLGVKRNRAAQWLAYHFMSSHCPLADAIIDELLGAGSHTSFDRTEYSVLTEVLANKMKST